METQIKKCPWCGKQGIVLQSGNRWIVRCPSTGDCPVIPMTWSESTKEGAIALWDDRD